MPQWLGKKCGRLIGGYEVGAVVFGAVAIFATGGLPEAAAGISFCCTFLAVK